MAKFDVSINYCTWHGNPASARRVVEAETIEAAVDLCVERVEKWKRYMGKLDMSACPISEGEE